MKKKKKSKKTPMWRCEVQYTTIEDNLEKEIKAERAIFGFWQERIREEGEISVLEKKLYEAKREKYISILKYYEGCQEKVGQRIVKLEKALKEERKGMEKSE